MRYLCIVFAFVALFLCGCADENIVHGDAPASIDITLTVLDDAKKTYITVPIEITGPRDYKGETDLDGKFILSNPERGEYVVTLLDSPEMSANFTIVENKTDYEVMISRPKVKCPSFDIVGLPEAEGMEKMVTIRAANESPVITENAFDLKESETDHRFESVDSTLSLPVGSFYIYCIVFIGADTAIYCSDNFSIAPNCESPMSVTLYIPTAQATITDENGVRLWEHEFCFEKEDKSSVLYMSSSATSFFLPAGKYNVFMNGISPYKVSLISPTTKMVNLKFKLYKISPASMSFVILKDDGTPVVGTDVSSATMSYNNGTTSFPLNYDESLGVWKVGGITMVSAGVYDINCDFFSTRVTIKNDSKYPMTVKLQ